MEGEDNPWSWPLRINQQSQCWRGLPGALMRQQPLGFPQGAALFHARVQPFFTPFQWTVGPYHRLATARARGHGHPVVGCLRSKLAAVQGLPASGVSGGRAGTPEERRPVWARP